MVGLCWFFGVVTVDYWCLFRWFERRWVAVEFRWQRMERWLLLLIKMYSQGCRFAWMVCSDGRQNDATDPSWPTDNYGFIGRHQQWWWWVTVPEWLNQKPWPETFHFRVLFWHLQTQIRVWILMTSILSGDNERLFQRFKLLGKWYWAWVEEIVKGILWSIWGDELGQWIGRDEESRCDGVWECFYGIFYCVFSFSYCMAIYRCVEWVLEGEKRGKYD